MTRSRAIDDQNDWLFGKGRNDYKLNQRAVEQDIRTRLNSFTGDCFFAAGDGLDWFNLLGAKDQTALNVAISAVILNTPGVTGLIQLSIVLNRTTRVLLVTYIAQTVYGPQAGQFQFNTNSVA